jgi:DNA-binding response OmpR family regulator
MNGSSVVPSHRILIIEDDELLARTLEIAMGKAGYSVTVTRDGSAFAKLVESARPDLALIDVSLPEGDDGFDLARQFRSMSDAPIVFVTAADALDDRLTGFALGADDYLVKPIAVAELLARVRAVLRRSNRALAQVIAVRDLVIDERNRQVTRSGARVALTPLEFEILATLARQPGEVFSKGQLLALVWGFDRYAPNLVEVHMSALRKKIDQGPIPLICTERGRGYVLRP